jgi:hypothetical protein
VLQRCTVALAGSRTATVAGLLLSLTVTARSGRRGWKSAVARLPSATFGVGSSSKVSAS